MAQPPNQTAAPPLERCRLWEHNQLKRWHNAQPVEQLFLTRNHKRTKILTTTAAQQQQQTVPSLPIYHQSQTAHHWTILCSIFNTHANQINIKQAVKKVLFPNIKFLGSKNDLEYSVETNLIAQIILTSLNLPENHNTRNVCWVQVCHLISDYLNLKQTAVVHAMKQKSNGTFMWCWQQFLDND